MKKAVLILSEFFPAKHRSAGKPTYFFEKISRNEKIHTIRGNFNWWLDKVLSINAGLMFMSIRKWSGKPYNSEQKEFTKLFDVWIQKITMTYTDNDELPRVWVDGKEVSIKDVAKNDGLSVDDFVDWFFGNSKNDVFTGCVIHFTDFLY